MKNILILIFILVLVGCAEWRLIDSNNSLDILKHKNITFDVYDLKTINKIYGKPDIVDFENNIVVYISRYRYESPISMLGSLPLEYEVWYLILHTDYSESKQVKGEIYKEHFDKPGEKSKAPWLFNSYWSIRSSYQEILQFCEKVN